MNDNLNKAAKEFAEEKEKFKQEEVSKILEEANGSWKDLVEEGFDLAERWQKRQSPLRWGKVSEEEILKHHLKGCFNHPEDMDARLGGLYEEIYAAMRDFAQQPPKVVFHSMEEHPMQEPGESTSKIVLVFDEAENTFCDLSYYDYEKEEWVIFGDMSMKLICWSYPPDPTSFLQTKNFKWEKHRGYC